MNPDPSPKRLRSKPISRTNARQMRKNPSDAEKILWRALRNKNLDELKFRRQHPIGHYIVDFYCPSQMLIIEVDGGTHLDQEEYDHRRTAWLEAQGYRVLRFTNDEIKNQLNAVVERIQSSCPPLLPVNPL